MNFYDDNFGCVEIEDEEDLAIYRRIQSSNVAKECSGCGRMVNIQPHYAYCDPCATRIEQGMDI